MGQVINKKIVVLISCLAITGFLVHFQPSSQSAKKQVILAEALSRINGWDSGGNILFDSRIIDALDLDDYVNLRFSNKTSSVSLYIGYYLTTKKVGAAHSPLVCFPGQGWILSDSENRLLKIEDEKVNLTYRVASIGRRKELLIYWFQSFDKTSPGTFLQKIHGLWVKFFYHREDNAFVRITVPMNGESIDNAYDTGMKFIESFYPRFLEFIKQNNYGS